MAHIGCDDRCPALCDGDVEPQDDPNDEPQWLTDLPDYVRERESEWQ